MKSIEELKREYIEHWNKNLKEMIFLFLGMNREELMRKMDRHIRDFNEQRDKGLKNLEDIKKESKND